MREFPYIFRAYTCLFIHLIFFNVCPNEGASYNPMRLISRQIWYRYSGFTVPILFYVSACWFLQSKSVSSKDSGKKK